MNKKSEVICWLSWAEEREREKEKERENERGNRFGLVKIFYWLRKAEQLIDVCFHIHVKVNDLKWKIGCILHEEYIQTKLFDKKSFVYSSMKCEEQVLVELFSKHLFVYLFEQN